MPLNKDEIEADFLFGYYEQDGNNAAVTGGIGTEQLEDLASLIVVKVPLDSVKSLTVNLGVDYYTSASTDNIDNNVSSASVEDVRAYVNFDYARKVPSRNVTYGFGGGFSVEYDYVSVSARANYTQEWNKGNSELSFTGQVFSDRWSRIFPAELRGVDVATSGRQSYNLALAYSQVINPRLQIGVAAEAIYMTGLLSTPFHRVYFADQARADIERLPGKRLKTPVSLRVNYFPLDAFVLRGFYRFYQDDFGLTAHTFSLEVPVKLGQTLTLYPFVRLHTQGASDYFAPYQTHLSTETFYTSDYDLSDLSSTKYGLGIGFKPIYGIGRVNLPFSKRLLVLDQIQLRSAFYQRSTGLQANLYSVNLGFKIIKR